MLITKTYRFKLRPTSAQSQRFEQWLGTCRYVYNLAKDCKETAYRKGKTLSYYDLKKQLPDLKSEEWIKDVQSQVLQDVVKRLDTAYQNFFRGAGYPKWATKGKFCSFNFPQGVSVNDNKVKLSKIGEVRFIKSQVVEGKIKQAKIKKEIDAGGRPGWYVSLTCITEQKYRYLPNESQIGIDVGIARYYTLSDRTYQSNPRFFYQLKDRLANAQRSLSRKQKGSENWKKQKKKVQRIHTKIARKRKDFQHQQTTRLVRKYGGIVVEDLRLKNMSKSTKGTVENPGKNVKAKSGLNRSMLDGAFGQFMWMLEYKSNWYGRVFQRVNPKNTSRECPDCGHTAKENRKSQSLFVCQACEYTANADYVGAVNIRGRAVPIVHGSGGYGKCDGQESIRASAR